MRITQRYSLVTSQSDAAPKLEPQRRRLLQSLVTSQSDAAPKRGYRGTGTGAV